MSHPHAHKHVSDILGSIDRRIARAIGQMPTMTLATVTQVSPLMVVVDSATSASPASRLDSYASPQLGDRVVVHWIKHQLVVAGTWS